MISVDASKQTQQKKGKKGTNVLIAFKELAYELLPTSDEQILKIDSEIKDIL